MVVKGARVVLADEVVETDIRIEEGRIAEIGTELSGKSIDLRGRYLLPAMVDIGVRMRDGRLRGGTLERLSKKAKENGFGAVIVSALCTPRIDDEITLEFAKSQADRCSGARIGTLLSGISEEGGLSDCAILLKEGAVGIEFESHIDGNLIRRLMEYAAGDGVKLFCHADDPALRGEGLMHEGKVSGELGLGGIPELSEYSQVARIGEFAETFGVDVVVMGASSARTLALCQKNPRLHAQVPLHHLLLSDEACRGYDTAAKILPPLRDAQGREALLEAVAEGAAAMITSLHSPVSATAKDAVFADAAFGIEGLQGFLPLLYGALIEPGYLGWSDAMRLVAAAPARAAGLSGYGRIEEDAVAALAVFDPQPHYRIEDPGSPYRGRFIRGVVTPLEIQDEWKDNKA